MTDTQITPTPHGETADHPTALFPRILCAVNGTRASVEAVRQATVLASCDGHLTLLAVSAIVGSGRYRTAALSPSHAERILDDAERIAREEGVECSRTVDPGGPPSEVILGSASGHDLLALGAPVRSWLGGALVGGVAYSVLGDCTIPVLMARRTHDRDAFASRILVASDGTEGSERLVEIAGSLAANREGSAVMVHALGGESKVQPRAIEAQRHSLERILGDKQVVKIAPDDAHTMILECAKAEGVSLIVIGTRRRVGLSALGSVSRRVIHKAPCSVLVVPPEREGN